MKLKPEFIIHNAGDEALEGKTFEKIGNAEGAAQ